MSCYRPLEAYRSVEGSVWLGYDPTRDGRRLELPCGRCIGCRLDRRFAWSVRIRHEAQMFASNWFATLTYRDDAVPVSLEYRHFQLFMKRLRKEIGGFEEGPEGGNPLRFFCAGEYGGRTGRPHYHAVLFNLRVGDERRYENGSYFSKRLEDLWSHGHVQLDEVTARSAAYVAGYTQKKVYGRARASAYESVVLETGEVVQRRPEFAAMSLKPGIGAWWYRRYRADLFPKDHAVVDGGKRCKVPRYYFEKFRREEDAAIVEDVLHARYERAMEKREDSTPARRAVREEAAEIRQSIFQERGL